jgi:hypothetical protein
VVDVESGTCNRPGGAAALTLGITDARNCMVDEAHAVAFPLS